MVQTLLVISAGSRGNGLTSVSLGLVRALRRMRLRVAFCKPIAQPSTGDDLAPDASTALARVTMGTAPPEPMARDEVEVLLGAGEDQILMERVVEICRGASAEADVLVVEGLVPVDDAVYGTAVNVAMAKALDARVILVGSADEHTPDEVVAAFSLAARSYGMLGDALLGVVVNRAPVQGEDFPMDYMMNEITAPPIPRSFAQPVHEGLEREGIRCLGMVPNTPLLSAPRISDVADILNAELLRPGNEGRRVHEVTVAAMTLPNVLERAIRPGALLLTPGDRADTLLAAALAEENGTRLAGVVLTGGLEPPAEALALCEGAFQAGLPLLRVATDTFQTVRDVINMDVQVPRDDPHRAELVVNTMASALDARALASTLADWPEPHLSPPAFRFELITRARAANKRIILPEGAEPRTLTAAVICARRGIARCVLMGDPDAIAAQARRQGLKLPEELEIMDPGEHLERLVPTLVSLRAHKGMHPLKAEGELHDNVTMGTVMLKLGEVDGLVSGAVHTTANTLRPALQLIKMAPGYSLVSSVFFMCLPDQVLVYGDCAVNPDPTAEELAEIAEQSVESAEAFGVPARVAMISYATGDSGAGAEVDKVIAATRLVRERRPDVPIDGPMQYDAASVLSVGAKKAPGSPVAGRATVFVFPDLNTGNTTYKAVQRSAGVVSIGPLLQGLALPVNDLSRGALVEDIVYTIALTAIQAEQRVAEAR